MSSDGAQTIPELLAELEAPAKQPVQPTSLSRALSVPKAAGPVRPVKLPRQSPGPDELQRRVQELADEVSSLKAAAIQQQAHIEQLSADLAKSEGRNRFAFEEGVQAAQGRSVTQLHTPPVYIPVPYACAPPAVFTQPFSFPLQAPPPYPSPHKPQFASLRRSSNKRKQPQN